jgi:hypothetical protein
LEVSISLPPEFLVLFSSVPSLLSNGLRDVKARMVISLRGQKCTGFKGIHGEKARTSLKPILGENFITPAIVSQKELFS